MSGSNNPTSPSNEWHSNEWQDPRWYPVGYQRDQLRFGPAQTRYTPLSKYAEEDPLEARIQESDPLRQLVRVTRHVENLHRFSDRRQEWFEEKPLPDGSNLNIMILEEDGTYTAKGSDLLRRTFTLYRQWLEWLYYETLLGIEGTRNAATDWKFEINVYDDHLITKILTVDFHHHAKMIADKERVQFRELDKFTQFDTDEGLKWILLWRRSIVNTLQDMKAACKRAASIGYHHRDSMIKVTVFETAWPLPGILTNNQAYGNLSDLHKVLVSILHKEELFEERLHLSHVEDEHIAKRIRLLTPEYHALAEPDDLNRLEKKYYPMIKMQTIPFQESLRNLFNFRQIREWGCVEPILGDEAEKSCTC